MSNFNVIELESRRLRRIERQVNRFAPWQNRYRDGIDGLVSGRWLRMSTGEVVPLVARSRSHANTN